MAEITIQITQTGESSSLAEIRKHKVAIDRPEAKGGTDKGAMGGELFLAALGGCFMSNLLAAIKARGVEASNLAIEVTGTLDGTPAVFSAADLKISGNYADRQQMEKLVEIADKGCIMANTVRNTVKLGFTLAHPSV